MQKEQFESRIRSLLPKATDKAITAWTAYAAELDAESAETEPDFYDKNYVELALAKRYYGEEIPAQLFNYGERFVFNYFESCGAAAQASCRSLERRLSAFWGR